MSARVFGSALPIAGTALMLVGTLIVALLHVLPPSSQVNPMTRTISEYALGANGWLFDVAVLALAVGLLAVLATLVHAEVLTGTGPATWLIGLSAACLMVLVVFQKYDHSGGHHAGGPGGLIHRMASLVAFLALPSGALLAARAGRRKPAWRRPARWTRGTAILTWALLCLLLYAIGKSFVSDVTWWRVFPLGALERVIGLGEVAVMLALGRWAILAGRSAGQLADPVGDRGGGTPLVQ